MERKSFLFSFFLHTCALLSGDRHSGAGGLAVHHEHFAGWAI